MGHLWSVFWGNLGEKNIEKHWEKCLLSWRLLLWLLSWCPIFKSSHCYSFEDWAPVDEIYGCPILKWVAETWPHDRVPGELPWQWLWGDMKLVTCHPSPQFLVTHFNVTHVISNGDSSVLIKFGNCSPRECWLIPFTEANHNPHKFISCLHPDFTNR